MLRIAIAVSVFFLDVAAAPAIYSLSLHDALPIFCRSSAGACDLAENCTGSGAACPADAKVASAGHAAPRSEEHTSELQSRRDLGCRLLLEKKKSTSAPCRLRPTPCPTPSAWSSAS